jgi:uncharacterized Rossmann fold enzyme
VKQLDATKKQDVSYCIPMWLRDLQIQYSTQRVKARIAASHEPKDEPVALACFGPSLNDTWEEIKKFKYVFSCSGAHPFLIERGIIPTWHVAVDPLPKNTVRLIGQPHKDVEYLISSTCHRDVFDHLEGYNVKLWHVFDNTLDGLRTLPHGEWALTGGCSVGLRMMTIADFLGFSDLHIFGMDGSEGATGKHAGTHPGQAQDHSLCEYPPNSGIMYRTTASFLEAARGTFHELDQMPRVKATFYGEGLTQAMAKDYVPNPIAKEKAIIAHIKPELISAEYKELNAKLHRENYAYGVGGEKYAPTVMKLSEQLKTKNILDYGCGKSRLAKALPFGICEYDPAVPGKDDSPKPADIVTCTDVLEHIEPDKILSVLGDLRRVVRQVGFFVIHTGASMKSLPDGRNTHILQRDKEWWTRMLGKFFTVAKVLESGKLLHVVVGVKKKAA